MALFGCFGPIYRGGQLGPSKTELNHLDWPTNVAPVCPSRTCPALGCACTRDLAALYKHLELHVPGTVHHTDSLALAELLFSCEGLWDHRCLVSSFLTYEFNFCASYGPWGRTEAQVPASRLGPQCRERHRANQPNPPSGPLGDQRRSCFPGEASCWTASRWGQHCRKRGDGRRCPVRGARGVRCQRRVGRAVERRGKGQMGREGIRCLRGKCRGAAN